MFKRNIQMLFICRNVQMLKHTNAVCICTAFICFDETDFPPSSLLPLCLFIHFSPACLTGDQEEKEEEDAC